MISAWWLIPAVATGVFIGVFIICLVSASRNDDMR